MVLRPPVEPMLARAAEVMPPVRPLASGVAYGQKFDGYRVLVFTPAGPGGRVLLQTRCGALVQGAFPDLVAAGEAQLPAGLVLDGELLVGDAEAGALSFKPAEAGAGGVGRFVWRGDVPLRRSVRAVQGADGTARRREIWSMSGV
ncbi:hypothetical protein [Streptomyces sp. NPDC058279]|uniref:hypothetical protein n=1 Tax=Streptomyces sp. NPDC058279 TaxID=3346418 RepID=UPI0036E21463